MKRLVILFACVAWALPLSVLLYAVCYWQNVPLLTSLAGIAAMLAFCKVVARRFPMLFSSFREYIYQIFLLSAVSRRTS